MIQGDGQTDKWTWLETIRDAYNVLNNVRNIIRILMTSEAQEDPTLAYEERMIETRRKKGPNKKEMARSNNDKNYISALGYS